MSNDEFNKVELPAINQLKKLNWKYIEGIKLSPDESDERKSFKHIILKSKLSHSIKKINSWINEDNLKKVVREFAQITNLNLMEANQKVYEKLTKYLSVEQDLGEGRKSHTVKIIDFENLENNEFLITNQFKVAGLNQNIVPDIVLFVNGLPLAVIECKSPFITNPMEAGINQLLRYCNNRKPEENEGAEKLFYYNQILVSTYNNQARLGTISSRYEHYLEWKDVYPKNIEDYKNKSSQEILIEGIFNHKNFLDIIRNFTIFEVVEGKTIKKITRYQQYRAVHKTIEKITKGKNKKEKGGVIWHTQGSGKSLTMVFLAQVIRRNEEFKKYKLLYITDRTQLDSQLTNTFQNTQDETVFQAESVQDLRELISKDSSDLITSTIQKFQEIKGENLEVLNDSERIVVLIDEAHRTQYGTFGMVLNTVLPNAAKIAFTGTPLLKSELTTSEFGDYIDKYTIEQSVEDGATLQILYEGREVKTRVEGESLDNLFDEYFSDKSEEEKNEIKRKYGIEKAVLEAPKRIRWVCLDIIKHYREKIQPNGFKAMIVTSSRNAAVLYKNILDELNAPSSNVVISGDHNDPENIKKYTDSNEHKKIIKDFKEQKLSESKCHFIIVKDMLLTGFDAPICQVMYLDRKIMDHSLLQAIARVNRPKEGKQRGFVVDYYGLASYLTSALDQFTQNDVQGALKELKDEIPKLDRAYNKVLEYFKDRDLEDLEECILVLEKEDIRQQFELSFRKFAKLMDIVLPDPYANKYLRDLKLLGKIVHGARNTYRDEQLNIIDAGEKVKKLIEENILASGVDPKIPPINLLDPKFKEEVVKTENPKMRAVEIKNAIRHHITVSLNDDPAYYRKLSERLEEIIQKYYDNWEEQARQLLLFKEECMNEPTPPEGLTNAELPFYNLYTEVLEKHFDEDDIPYEDAKKIASELVEYLNEVSQIVDFFNKPDEIKRLKRKINDLILQTDHSDQDLINNITESFMDLAKHKYA